MKQRQDRPAETPGCPGDATSFLVYFAVKSGFPWEAICFSVASMRVTTGLGRGVEEVHRILLTLVDCPVEELHQGPALLGVGLLFVDQEPGEARDGVGGLAGGIGQGTRKSARHGLGRPGRRGGRALDAGLDELARRRSGRRSGRWFWMA